MKKRRTVLQGYSLLELLVTLTVFAVLITMIVQVLLLSIESGRKIAVRSKFRGDLSEVAVMMRRDFRNAGKIDLANCGEHINYSTPDGKLLVSNTSACFFNIAGVDYAWVHGNGLGESECEKGKICKLRKNIDGNYETFYLSSDILYFEENLTWFDLSYNKSIDGTVEEGTFLALIVANVPPDSNWDVVRQYRQISVFTRNF